LSQQFSPNLMNGKRRMMGRNRFPISRIIKYASGIAVAAVIILFISLSGFFFPKEEKLLAPPLRKPEEIVYKTYKVKKAYIENRITCRGYFIPEKQVDVSFESRDGYLKVLYVSAGQDITRGMILAALDTDTLENDIKRQTLILRGKEETHSKLKEISEIDIQMSRIRLKELQDDLETSYQMKETIARAEITKQENEVKIQEYLLNKQILDYEYQISAAERDIEMARLQLSELKLELEKSIIRAPLSGQANYVAPINQGEFVPSYKTVVSVADVRRLVLQYRGDQHTHFRLGMNVDVDIDGKMYSGKVVMTPLQVPSEDYEQMKEMIRIQVDNLPPGLDIDDAAIIGVTLEQADNVIVLPKRLVHNYAGRTLVKILENGIVNERDVEIGIRTSTQYEIKSGLEPGDLVVE
jgi:macrolide-specific efflux system membrane fusion protein